MYRPLDVGGPGRDLPTPLRDGGGEGGGAGTGEVCAEGGVGGRGRAESSGRAIMLTARQRK